MRTGDKYQEASVMKKAWIYVGVFVVVFGFALMLGGKEGRSRAGEQVRGWLIGERAPSRPIFIYGKTFRPQPGNSEKPKMIKTASGMITVWLPSSGDACAHEAYCSLVPDGGGAPAGDVLVWWLDSWQEGEVPPFVNKHKFEVIAAVNWQALGAADAQDSYEITLTGDDGFEEFPWSIVYDTNSRSMSARIGDASIEHVTDAYDGAFCVSVQDTAWHGTAALPAYDGLNSRTSR